PANTRGLARAFFSWAAIIIFPQPVSAVPNLLSNSAALAVVSQQLFCRGLPCTGQRLKARPIFLASLTCYPVFYPNKTKPSLSLHHGLCPNQVPPPRCLSSFAVAWFAVARLSVV